MGNYNKTTNKVTKVTKKPVQNPLNRDAMDNKLFFKFFNGLPRNTFVEKRLVLCVILLYITGCRVNELRNFNKLLIQDLIIRGTVIIHTYKTRTTRRIDIGTKGQNLLQNNLELIEDFYKVLKPTDHVLSTEQGKEMNTRSVFNWLNKELREFGEKSGKTLLSHSFRIGYVTKILRNHNPQIAQSIIGHKDITTTIRYDRNSLNSDEVKAILDEE